ncbi:hypothetical protein NQ561_00970 [Anaerostipes caccae L1-92]|uniref:Core-binding (CB) domain-containing protein n=2 Tax=Anaerostipes caccae TaxID=105841 RepID=B0MFA4_ANACD|nr:hypothetical protein [Anaerostipes caccae]EDR97209.1 hypothetical protein ANACAC_02439 [Anaerostipes caccae L1-92]UWN71767.1 hypothetical protein NQ561_00970 [Anaerostipes caccae L1-92]
MNEIKLRDIMQWQNQLIQMKTKDGEEYTKKYLKTVQTQLSPVFNHAVKYYDLPRNPVKDAETIDAERSLRINFLTK